MARLCPDQTFLSLCHRRHVASLCMAYKVNWNSNHCLYSELPSVSVRVRQNRAAAAAHPLEFEVSRCRTSQFARCFLSAQARVWNDLPCTLFDTRTLDGFKGAQSLVILYIPEFVFQFFVAQVHVAKVIYKQFCFSHLGLCLLVLKIIIIIIIIIIITSIACPKLWINYNYRTIYIRVNVFLLT